jgi:hypothetical protein
MASGSGGEYNREGVRNLECCHPQHSWPQYSKSFIANGKYQSLDPEETTQTDSILRILFLTK